MGGRQKGSKNKEPYRRKSNRGILLERAWRSIRIIRNGFTIPSLLATSSFGEESEKAAIRYLGIWLRRLVIHGYIRKIGSLSKVKKLGEFQTYALVKNQVERPLYCDTCGQSLVSKICDPSLLKKKRKKEKKKETEKQEVCGCEEINQVTDEKVEVDHE